VTLAPRLAALLLLLLSGCGGCGQKASTAKDMPSSEAHAVDGVRPVYSTPLQLDARAAQLCKALHALPETRRASCCAGRPAIDLADACTGILSAALRSEALGLEATRLEACAAALDTAYAGCAWVGPFGPPFPKECASLFTGRRAAGEKCSSSLECFSGLVCAGAGPTDTGRCSPPGPKGSSCGTAVDVLASYTRQDAEALHPPCQGLCRRHRCEEAVTAGGACESSQQCLSGHHCAEGLCLPGPATEGQRCSGGDCAPGLRCLEGACVAPLPAGASCTRDFQCAGGCLLAAGGGHCGMGCALR
jgi:hypothetical protein